MVAKPKMLVEHVDDGFFIIKDDIIVFANRAFASMHGTSKKEVLEKNIVNFVAPASCDEFKERFSEVSIKVSPQIRYEYKRLHRSGQLIPTELRANKIPSINGAVFAGICLDLTERKQSEETLRQLKEFSENILSSSYDSITVVDQEGSIIYFSPASERITKFKKEEVIGTPLSFFYKDKELFKRKIEELEKTKAPVSYEATILDKEGNEHIMFVSRSPLKDSNENCIGSVGVCKDITERRLIEEKIRERERLAYIGQLTTLLAHEIRNPLSSVKMNVQILSKKLNLSGNDQRRMEIVGSEIKRLEVILEEVLNFAKPMKLFLKAENINEIIGEVLENLSEKIGEKKIRIEESLDKDLPRIFLDRGKIQQAFLNIVLNAIDALHENGNLKIVSSIEKILDETIIKIEVSDNGIGIEEKNVKDVFKPFFTTKQMGTGLGLANVEKIIETHGGFIKVDSRLGQGTSIYVFLKER
jgi:PAS domain S-box-containing protein